MIPVVYPVTVSVTTCMVLPVSKASARAIIIHFVGPIVKQAAYCLIGTFNEKVMVLEALSARSDTENPTG